MDSKGEMRGSFSFPQKTESRVAQRREKACWETKQRTSLPGRLNGAGRRLLCFRRPWGALEGC